MLGKLSDLVINHVEPDNHICPFCEYRMVSYYGKYTTLLSYGGAVNPNHIWKDAVCCACDSKWVREEKSGNIWLTKKSRVIQGLPNCFESYIFTCRYCAGDVLRLHTDLDGNPLGPSIGLCTIGGIKQYRTFYNCQKCDREVEVNDSRAD